MKKINLLLAGFVALTFSAATASAQSGIITTIAGNATPGYGGDGGPATAAQMNYPQGVAIDATGNLYVSDVQNQAVRKITPAGIITTIAGNGTQGFSGDGGPATAAELSRPYGVAVDAGGNVYIADCFNFRVRKVNPAGIITTFAGIGSLPAYSGDGGPATAAAVEYPNAVAVDASGNVYIADYINSVIRKVNTAGIISTIAGTGTSGFSGDGGPATAAQINQPWGLAFDGSGSIYFSDYYNYRIRKINAAGIISTIAGNGTQGNTGDGGPATAAEVNRIYGVAVDNTNNVYFADGASNKIRMINPSGIINTFAGTGTLGYAGDGGAAAAAELSFPMYITISNSGNIIISDVNNNCVRQIAGAVSTAVGSVSTAGGIDIFPNPNTGSFFIQLPAGQDHARITVSDVTGKVVRDLKTTGTRIEVDMAGMPKDNYLVTVQCGANQYVHKVTIW